MTNMRLPTGFRPLLRSRYSVEDEPGDIEALTLSAKESAASPIRTVMDKKTLSAGGDPHDYFSLAKYTWPDPDTPDGLPYIHRDGVVNPEVEDYDAPAWKATQSAIMTLSRASRETGSSEFAIAAGDRVRAWFIDPDTRMTPHLRHAQYVPGNCDGRGHGIIEWSTGFPALLEAWGAISPLAFSPDEDRAFHQWCSELLDWLLESDFGIQAAQYANNHSIYYDILTAYLSLWLGRDAEARQILEQVPARRIGPQIEPDGRMPHELRRTKSYDYTRMNLSGFCKLATLAEHVDLDLWRWESADGRSIKAAFLFFHDFLKGHEPWPYEQIIAPNHAPSISLIGLAERVYGAPFAMENARHRLAP